MADQRPDYPESIHDPLPIEETDRMIASDKVEGTAVFDGNGQKIGTVRNFMVDKYSGEVQYAVMSFGGFLGIGERYHPLPWKALRYDPELGGYVVGLSKEALEKAPSYERDNAPAFTREYGQGVYGYYGVPFPY